MADQQQTNGDQQQQSQQQAPATKFVGKYETVEAFEQGIREIAGKVEYPIPDGSLIGEGKTFATVDAATAAYKAFTRMNTQAANRNQQQQAQGDKDQQQQSSTPNTGDGLQIDKPKLNAESTVDDVLAAAGVTKDEVAEQLKQGDLNADTYTKLASLGYPKAVVKAFLQGQMVQTQAMQAQVETIKASVINSIGGQQAHDTLRAFAATTLAGNDPTFQALNAQVNTNPAIYPALMQYVKGRYDEAAKSGKAKPLIQGGSTNATTAGPITNGQQFIELTRKARNGDEEARRALLAHARQAR